MKILRDYIPHLMRDVIVLPKTHDVFQIGSGRILPEEYKKFYNEWKVKEKEPVHYIPKPGKWERDPETGQVKRVHNLPIKLLDLPEMHEGIWGGEHIIQGYKKKSEDKPFLPEFWMPYKNKAYYNAKVPYFWMPQLLDGVVYSEILDKHISVIITPRVIDLINKNFGFDHYILKTPACDLYTMLSLKIKKKLLKTLYEKTLYPEDEQKREEVYNTYKHYVENYTEKEIEWYGLTMCEAKMKANRIFAKKVEESVRPLKHQYRKEFIEYIKTINTDDYFRDGDKEKRSWWRKTLFPFS